MFTLKVILEVILVIFIGVGILYEEKLIELEEVLWWCIGHPVKTIKNIKSYVGGTDER